MTAQRGDSERSGTAPDPVTDVWELLWTAACDYRDANPQRSEARLVDALMPVVQAYGDEREQAVRQRVQAALNGALMVPQAEIRRALKEVYPKAINPDKPAKADAP